MDVSVLAGSFSTAVFVGSYLPMLAKAARTRDLDSYSRGQLTLANVGNLINSLYVFSLPVGPIWFLHSFNLVCTLFMLVWHLRFATPQGVVPTLWTRALSSCAHPRQFQPGAFESGVGGDDVDGPRRCVAPDGELASQHCVG